MLGQSILWSGLGAVALAVGVGVQLGESAVHQIDPLYFEGPAIHPRDRGAALDPNNLPGPIVSPYTQAYGWAQQNAALYAAAQTPDYPYAPDPAPVAYQAEEPQFEVVQPTSLQPWPAGQVTANPQVERYASYQIEEKPVPAAAAPEPAAVQAPSTASPQVLPTAQPLSATPALVYEK